MSQASVGKGAEVVGARSRVHLGSAEDIDSYTKDIVDRAGGERLDAFLTFESQEATLLLNNGRQVRRAQRNLRKEKFEDADYSDLEGAAGAGRTARRELVVEELMALDASTRTLIQVNSHPELRDYLGDFATAAEMFQAIPLFFGGASQEQQLNVKTLLKLASYKFDKEGQGARNLHKRITALGKRLGKAGGSIEPAEVMQTIIDKFRLKSDGIDLYNFTSQSLLTDLNRGLLTLTALRTTMIAAEQRIEKQMSEDGVEIHPDGGAAMVTLTKSTSTFTPEQISALDKRDAKHLVMVTNAVKKGMSAQGGGGGKSVCYNFRDTGTCKFGDTCRFSH
jgi:hypothetical protein